VVGEGGVARPQLEPGDEQPARPQVPPEIRHDGLLRPGGEQDQDVPGGEDEVERPLEVDRREVGLDPAKLGRSAPGRPKHVRVQIDTDHIDAAPGELTPDATGPATGIEDRRGGIPHHEVGFAMDVLTRRRPSVVARVVGLAGQVLRA